MRMVNLDAAAFEDFLRCLAILKEDCNDVDIRNGVIRQRSNKKDSVFELNLSNIISDISLPISMLKSKLNMLGIFAGGEVAIEVDDENFSFSDDQTTLKFKSPLLNYLDNKFMSEEEMSNSFVLNNDDIFLQTTISKRAADRVKVVAQEFNVNAIQVVLAGDAASIVTRDQSGDQFAKFVENIVTERSMNASTNIVTIPFVIDRDADVELKMFNIRDNLVITKFSTEVADVNVNIYTRSILIEEESSESEDNE